MADEVKALSARDRDAVAEYLKGEKQDRARKRIDLEKKWDEIDRQLEMMPKERTATSGANSDWYPDLEEPLQYNALEVVLADLDAMLFPQGTEWWTGLSYLSESYLERFNRRRETRPLIAEGEAVGLDQQGADALVKGTLDYFHKLHDFRGKLNLALAETVKYGIGVCRVVEVVSPKFIHEFRGVKAETIKGPALAPTSIRNTYPDDSPTFTLHEGQAISPTTIKAGSQLLESLKRAAKIGGSERGWIMADVNKLEPLKRGSRRGWVETIEAEGDLIVPKSRGSIFLPNVIVTIAHGGNGSKMVRYRPNPRPFRSYVFINYLRDKIQSPYGGSPMLKSQPLQEAAAFMLNDLIAGGHMNAKPPVVWDRSDAQLAAEGGPDLFPGAKIGTDNMDGVAPVQIADINGLAAAYGMLLKKFEDLTAVNDPRRGAGVRSHTGTGANELQFLRGVARTQNLADDIASGPMISMLQMEYDIIKGAMRSPMPIPIDRVGIEGWVELAAADLPDQVSFRVHGASGVSTQREKVANFQAATQFSLQVVQLAAQLGVPINIDFVELITEAYQNAGINNVARFVRAQETVEQPTDDEIRRQINLQRDDEGVLQGAEIVPLGA